jgi:ActR/RegA family two-component response regulator
MRKQWILLVGISKYVDHRLAPLPGVRIDIDLLRMCLEEFHTFPLGGTIEDLRDAAATQENILSIFERMCEQAGPEDQIFLFLAGHGTVVSAGSAASVGNLGTTHFLAADADVDTLSGHAIRSEDIAARLGNTKAQQVALIFDFCSGAGLTFALPSLTSLPLESRDWFVGVTCRSYQSVADTTKGGFFIRHFCDALSGRVQQQRAHVSVDVRTAFEYATDHARAALAQAGFPQQPRHAQTGRAILLTTPPRPLVRQTWRSVLLLEDDVRYGQLIEGLLAENGYRVQWLQSVDDLSLDRLAELPLDLAIVDLCFGAEPKGLLAVRGLRRANPLLPILVVTAHLSTEFGLKAGKAGADDLLFKKPLPESDEFREALLARIDGLHRKQRDSNIPNLEKRLRQLGMSTLYTTILEPLYEKRGFTELRYQDVPARAGGSLRVLSCTKDNGLHELEGFGVYAVLDDISVHTAGSDAGLPAAVVIDHLEDIYHHTVVDIASQGRTRLHRVILHSTGYVSSGARDLIRSAPSIRRRVVIFDNADLIGILRAEGLDHRLAFAPPSNKVHLYLLGNRSIPSCVSTWIDLFRTLLQPIEQSYPLDSQRCLQKILEREAIACGAMPSAVGACHIYEPRLPVNLVFVILISEVLPWSPACGEIDTRHPILPRCTNRSPACGDVRLGFLSILGGDETQDHTIRLRRIMQSLIGNWLHQPIHLEYGADTVLQKNEAWLRQRLTPSGFQISLFYDIGASSLNQERQS